MNAKSMSTDRDLQDEVIRYLADAGRKPSAILNATEAKKAQRFSRFLARRYYRDRLQRAFRYSRKWLVDHQEQLGEIVDSPEFDAFLSGCVLGSLTSAREVGEMAMSQLLQARAPGPWWPELLQYEFAFFVQLASSEIESPSETPRVAKSTICSEFSWKMPALLTALKSGQVPDETLRGRTLLLFSRTRHGKIFVVELDAAALALLNAVKGERSIAEIASVARLSEGDARRILTSLKEIGAVLLPAGE
jgi:hypothetical protein